MLGKAKKVSHFADSFKSAGGFGFREDFFCRQMFFFRDFFGGGRSINGRKFGYDFRRFFSGGLNYKNVKLKN